MRILILEDDPKDLRTASDVAIAAGLRRLEQVRVLVEVVPVQDVGVRGGQPRRYVPADLAEVAGLTGVLGHLLLGDVLLPARSGHHAPSRADALDLAVGRERLQHLCDRADQHGRPLRPGIQQK